MKLRTTIKICCIFQTLTSATTDLLSMIYCKGCVGTSGQRHGEFDNLRTNILLLIGIAPCPLGTLTELTSEINMAHRINMADHDGIYNFILSFSICREILPYFECMIYNHIKQQTNHLVTVCN